MAYKRHTTGGFENISERLLRLTTAPWLRPITTAIKRIPTAADAVEQQAASYDLFLGRQPLVLPQSLLRLG